MRRFRAGPIVGTAGAVVMALAMLITAIPYTGTAGEPYSPLNHFVSELGELGVSSLALVFNLGLIVGGVCFALFMASLGRLRRTRLAWFHAPIGVAAGVAGALVGVFPMNNLQAHSLAALTFFSLGWICVGLASLDFVRRPDPRFPRAVVYLGALTVAFVLGFLASIAPLIRGAGLGAPDIRPAFWIVPTLEWAVVVGILGWTFATSFTWWRYELGGR